MTDNSLYYLSRCTDFNILNESLTKTELLIFEKIIDECSLIDERPHPLSEDYITEPYEDFSVEMPEGYPYSEDDVKPLLLWYESLEDTGYAIEKVQELCDPKEYNMAGMAQYMLVNGQFSITEGNLDFGCTGICCHFSDGHNESEFYFSDTADDFDGSASDYVKKHGLSYVAEEIKETLIAMAEHEYTAGETVTYLTAMKTIADEVGIELSENSEIDDVLNIALESEYER